MDGSIFTLAARVRLCTRCYRITWRPDLCSLCQKGATTRA